MNPRGELDPVRREVFNDKILYQSTAIRTNSLTMMPILNMRGFIIPLLVASAATLCTSGVARAADLAPVAPDPIRAAFFDDATFTLHVRSYLFDRTNNPGDDPAAWAIGGWVGYQTGWIGDILQFGAVAYTSQPLWAPEDRAGSLLLLPDQDGFSVLGQAYAALRYEGQVLTLGRQMVDQPEINPHDNRMVPITYEGGSLGGDVGIFSYYAAFLTGTKTRGSDQFDNFAEVVGVDQDEPMYLGGLALAPSDDLKARTSLYVVPDILLSSYSDGGWSGQFDGFSLNISGQFMIQTGIGDELLTGPDFTPWVAGIKADVSRGGLTLTAGYTANGSNDDWQSPYGMWPGYTNMVIGVFDRAGEQTLLLGAAYDLAHVGIDGLTLSTLVAIDTHVAEDLPMWSEYDFIASYNLSAIDSLPHWLSPLSLNAQYGLLQSDEPDGDSNLSDELRLILNYELKSTGTDL
jgi:hypothetical protein